MIMWFKKISAVFAHLYSKKLMTAVEGNLSRATTPSVTFQELLHRGVGKGATPFHGLLHFTLNTNLKMLSVKQGGIKYHFLSLWYHSNWN